MDPIALIKEDHRRVEALFEAYRQLDEEAYNEKKELVETIMDELEAHMEMEETIAYPAFRESFDDEGEKEVEEGYAEHDVAKNLMEELRGLAPDDAQYEAKVTVLEESIAHHVEEEESDMLPKAEEEVSGEEMARIGEEMQAFKDARDDAAMDAVVDEEL